MSDELKPCPFCSSNDGMPFIRPSDRWRYIQCISCMCTSGARPTLELAISAWNQRDLRNKKPQTNNGSTE